MAKIERQKRIYRKRIPYGMQNFEDVMERDCYYVDKTPFIEKIEESNMYFFFIRPRRFGKSLTLSMLENYYDINKKDKFGKPLRQALHRRESYPRTQQLSHPASEFCYSCGWT